MLSNSIINNGLHQTLQTLSNKVDTIVPVMVQKRN